MSTVNESSPAGGMAAMVATGGAFPILQECVTADAYEIDPLCDPRWAVLVDGHPQASVFHTPKWLRALRNVYGYEPVAITTRPPGTCLTNGFVFCRIKSWLTGRRLVSLPFSDHCEPLADSQDELDEMLLHMKRHVDQHGWEYVEIRPVSCQPSGSTKLGKGVTYSLHRLDLRPSQQELFHNFHKDCVQRKIRRAEREKLHYEAGASEDLLQQFYRLLVMTRRRQYLPPQPLKWFRGLISAFGDDLKIRVASKDGVAIASILTISHKKSMVYKYGCSDPSFNRLGGTALLFWKAIQEAKTDGLEELEMGRSDADNLGLIAFKQHWGASGTPISYWTYPYRGPGLPSVWKKQLARRVVPAISDWALETIGTLLYRHIG